MLAYNLLARHVRIAKGQHLKLKDLLKARLLPNSLELVRDEAPAAWSERLVDEGQLHLVAFSKAV